MKFPNCLLISSGRTCDQFVVPISGSNLRSITLRTVIYFFCFLSVENPIGLDFWFMPILQGAFFHSRCASFFSFSVLSNANQYRCCQSDICNKCIVRNWQLEPHFFRIYTRAVENTALSKIVFLEGSFTSGVVMQRFTLSMLS